jgi:hypothetical protein
MSKIKTTKKGRILEGQELNKVRRKESKKILGKKEESKIRGIK